MLSFVSSNMAPEKVLSAFCNGRESNDCVLLVCFSCCPSWVEICELFTTKVVKKAPSFVCIHSMHHGSTVTLQLLSS